MGSGIFTTSSYVCYNSSLGRTYDLKTSRVVGQSFDSVRMDESLDPKKFTIRECVNSEEHPNTVPVILALDVTGSMGDACAETAATLGKIITNLYKNFKDIEICVMGIGDLDYDRAPLQMSQFESDVRIAVALDKIFIEKGGGGNDFESYTLAWYAGLNKTKLDCFDKQGRKGIIITMGDEPLNPYLPKNELNRYLNVTEQDDVETNKLFEKASEKFNIYHIAVDGGHKNCYSRHAKEIENSFGQLLGERFKVSTINQLSDVIEQCITESIQNRGVETETQTQVLIDENGGVVW